VATESAERRALDELARFRRNNTEPSELELFAIMLGDRWLSRRRGTGRSARPLFAGRSRRWALFCASYVARDLALSIRPRLPGMSP
jgi:hypothetical protein